MAPRTPVIAIVGRPNVGKSTLFNRILGEQKAIVEDIAGVTRDRNYALIERFEVPFLLVDTGGFEEDPEDEIGKQVVQQTMIAAEEADVVLAIFDGALGCLDGDREVVSMLRRIKKSCYFVVNKCDGMEQAIRVADFYQLGVDTLHDCSALHGRGVSNLIEQVLSELPNYQGLLASITARKEREELARKEAAEIAEQVSAKEQQDLLDEIGAEEESPFDQELPPDEPSFAPVYLPDESDISETEYEREHRTLPLSMSQPKIPEDDSEPLWRGDQDESVQSGVPVHIENIRVALVGRPNVGKSTLLNVLTGERRAIVSPIAGTTRDVLDLTIRRDGQDFTIVDTAGLRKQGKVELGIERYSAIRSLGALTSADVAVVVIDAEVGPTEQDTKIVGLAHEHGAGIVIAVNKWDLVPKTHTTVHQFTEKIREAFKFAPYAPIVFTSALSGRRCPKIIEAAKEVAYQRNKRITTAEVNRILQRAMKRFSPAPYRGREIKLFYGVQVDVAPPRFTLFFNYPRALHFSFLRFLKNAMRDEFAFVGTDIKIFARKK